MLPSVGRAGVGLAFGADYYPEQWPAATWQQDIELMSSTGVNVVRIGTFCWCHVEPEGPWPGPWAPLMDTYLFSRMAWVSGICWSSLEWDLTNGTQDLYRA